MSAGGDLPDWQTRVSQQEEVTIASFFLAGGFSSAVYDVSQYQSLIIQRSGGNPDSTQDLNIYWADDLNNVVGVDSIESPGAVGAFIYKAITVPVRSGRVQLFNNDPQGFDVTLLGTQRPQRNLVSSGYLDTSLWTFTGALVAGVTQQLSGPTSPPATQGLHQVSFSVSNVAVTGHFVVSCHDPAAGNFGVILADTSEFHNFGGQLRFVRQVLLPASPYSLGFLPVAGGNSTVQMRMIAQGY